MKVDRVFLDANILYSVCHGSPGLERLWDLAEKGACRLPASGYVIDEARRNLQSPERVRRLDDFLLHMEVVLEADMRIECPVSLDERDRPVLMAAISAWADYLLTGDKRHFGDYFGQRIAGVEVCLPRKYLLSRIHREKNAE